MTASWRIHKCSLALNQLLQALIGPNRALWKQCGDLANHWSAIGPTHVIPCPSLTFYRVSPAGSSRFWVLSPPVLLSSPLTRLGLSMTSQTIIACLHQRHLHSLRSYLCYLKAFLGVFHFQCLPLAPFYLLSSRFVRLHFYRPYCDCQPLLTLVLSCWTLTLPRRYSLTFRAICQSKASSWVGR